MGRFPSSTIFNGRPSRSDSSFTSLSACDGLYISGQVYDVPKAMRLRFRVGRLECSDLEKEPRSHICPSPGLSSVRGQRSGCQRHAFRNGAVPVKLQFSIDHRRETTVRSRSLGACGRLYPPGVVRELPGPWRHRFRVGRLQRLPGLEKER